MLVIGFALLLVAVVASRHSHLIAGSGVASPVPGPPAVGDCVLDPVFDSILLATTLTATSGGTSPVYPVVRTQSCRLDRYGDVASVIASPKPTVVRGDADNRYLEDPNEDTCRRDAVKYLGLPAERSQGFWQPAAGYITSLSGPSLRQEAAGQHWAACIVSIPQPGVTPTPSTTKVAGPPPLQYGGSIRDALHTGAQRDQLGNCMPASDLPGDGNSVVCGRPHAFEVMGLGGSADHAVDRSQLQTTCRQLVGRLTGMADPTAAGALTIDIYAWDMDGSLRSISHVPSNVGLICGVATTGTRKLHGSLLALGTQPIPWV